MAKKSKSPAGSRAARKKLATDDVPAASTEDKVDPEAKIGVETIGGVQVDVYGSLIKTVQKVKDLSRSKLRTMYASITGDDRPDVDAQAATDVVAGEVQNRWYVARGKTPPERVAKNQEERVAKAKKSRQVEEAKPATKKTTRKRATEEAPAEEATLKRKRGKKSEEAPAEEATPKRKRGKKSEEAPAEEATPKPKRTRAAAPAPEADFKPRKGHKADHIRRYLLDGMTDEDKIIEKVKKACPGKNCTRGDVRWYRARLVESGALKDA